MRALFATTAGAGHFGPMVPFASALRGAGHEVVVAAPGSFGDAVERAGFEHLPFADADQETMGRVFASLPAMSPDDANATVARDVFGRLDAQAARPGLESIVDSWRPDVIVREPAEVASFAVAQAHSIPHLRVAIGLLSFEARIFDVLDKPLTELGCPIGVDGLRAEAGLPLLPESFEDGMEAGSGLVRRFRDPAMAASREPLPDGWWDGRADIPLVYVTFGSVAGTIPPFAGLYGQASRVVAELPVRVLLTTGPGVDIGGIGPLPRNVHVERWWPQQQVMAHASAMVGHGGFGTTLFGLASGVPQGRRPPLRRPARERQAGGRDRRGCGRARRHGGHGR